MLIRGINLSVRVSIAAAIGVGGFMLTQKSLEFFKQFDMVKPNAEIPVLAIGSLVGLGAGKYVGFYGTEDN